MLTNKAIQRAQLKMRQAASAHSKACYEAFCSCKHTFVAEADYQPSDFGSSPPWRVCLSCGLGEVGWGCGYLVLQAKQFEPISRDEIFRLMQARIQDHHKGPLLRQETTLDALVREQYGIEEVEHV
jgi:hypothetical protein